MSLIPTIYSSADPGAPQLSGIAGSMCALLDAVLVTGYGSGPDAKPPLGWTRPYTGTNLRVYRGSPVTGTGYFLRLDDTQARLARFRGYTSMTAISTGTGVTPTAAQRPNGALWVRSPSANATVRPWWLIGNERAFYLFVSTSDQYPGIESAVANFAGDFLSNKAADGHNFFLSSVSADSVTSDYDEHSALFLNPQPVGGGVASPPSGYLARGHAGTGGALPAGFVENAERARFIGFSNLPYPDPISNGLIWDHAWLHEGAGLVRGRLPGLIVPMHKRPFADLQVVTDLPDFPIGTTLVAKSLLFGSPAYYEPGQLLFDLGAWV